MAPLTARTFLGLFALAVSAAFRPAGRAEAVDATATARDLCDALVTAMKKGPALDFTARRELLAPVIERDFDLGFMTRLVVGPPWRSLGAEDRQKLIEAFSAYSIATYAQRFKSYSGERFEVDPAATPQPRESAIVHTKLHTGSGEPVQLDYLMRKDAGRWQIIDVYLNGTISEMAARRSEYATILRQGGAAALIALLRRKAGELGSQREESS